MARASIVVKRRVVHSGNSNHRRRIKLSSTSISMKISLLFQNLSNQLSLQLFKNLRKQPQSPKNNPGTPPNSPIRPVSLNLPTSSVVRKPRQEMSKMQLHLLTLPLDMMGWISTMSLCLIVLPFKAPRCSLEPRLHLRRKCPPRGILHPPPRHRPMSVLASFSKTSKTVFELTQSSHYKKRDHWLVRKVRQSVRCLDQPFHSGRP